MGRLLNLKITESILELKKIQKRQVSIKAERRILCLILLKSITSNHHYLNTFNDVFYN